MIFIVPLVHSSTQVPYFINQLCVVFCSCVPLCFPVSSCLVHIAFLVRSLLFFCRFSFPSVLCNKPNLKERERERERERHTHTDTHTEGERHTEKETTEFIRPESLEDFVGLEPLVDLAVTMTTRADYISWMHHD